MTTTINIRGMSCQHCVDHVKKALEDIAGVMSARVDLQNKSAQVEHNDSVSMEIMKEAVSEAGYESC